MSYETTKVEPSFQVVHGARDLPFVRVDSYNLEIRDGRKFVGDQAKKSAFLVEIEKVRRHLKARDPFDGRESRSLRTSDIERAMKTATGRALVSDAAESFAGRLNEVIRRYRQSNPWKDIHRIAMGGGLSGSPAGPVIAKKTDRLLRDMEKKCRIDVIHQDADDAGLIGALYLVPPWMYSGYDAILAVDIGGTKMRAGIVKITHRNHHVPRGTVVKRVIWRHADDETASRDKAVGSLEQMLRRLISHCRSHGVALAPLIGIGCPGKIRTDGSIQRGDQNLPGNWAHSDFNLPAELENAVGPIDGYPPVAVMHNDAVVQGLSELPWMTGKKRWGILTIGTGLGNASFTPVGAATRQ